MLVTEPESAGIDIPPFRLLPADLPIVPFVRSGNLIFVSGQIPDIAGMASIRGRLGSEIDVETGREAARRAGVNVLSVLEHAAGGLGNVLRITKMLGFVSSAPGFTDQPVVVNAASELFVALWGREHGAHARSAVGVAELPFGVPVEIELIAELADDR